MNDDDFSSLEQLADDRTIVVQVPESASKAVRDLTLEAQRADLRIAQLEAELAREKTEQVRRLTVLLPAAMEEAKIIDITYPSLAEGLPDVLLSAKPFYSANIAADWDEDRRRVAFSHLDNIGAGDLIKTVVTIPFGREMRKTAVDLANMLRQRGYPVEVKESVHMMTLTSWLKERSQRETVPQDTLEKIGGTVGRTAVLKSLDADGKAIPKRPVSGSTKKRRR